MKQVPGACGALVCCAQSAPAQGPACLGLRLAATGVDRRGRGVEPQAVSSAQPAVASCSLWSGLPTPPQLSEVHRLLEEEDSKKNQFKPSFKPNDLYPDCYL